MAGGLPCQRDEILMGWTDMPMLSPPPPDCRLSHVLLGQIPRAHASGLILAVADAAGRYLRAGGRLPAVEVDASFVREGRVVLMPPAPGGGLAQRPRQVEEDLLFLRQQHPRFPGTLREALGFLLRFAKALDPVDGPAWARLWIRTQGLAHQREVSIRHRAALRAFPPPGREGLAGTWAPNPELPLPVLRDHLLEMTHQQGLPLHESRRSEIWQGQVLGEEVIVKSYQVREGPWKSLWHRSRARRAWAGATSLRALGLPCPMPLGFLEIHEPGLPCKSMFISRAIPGAQTARRALKARLHRLPAEERSRLRHQLRALIFDLGKHGIYHRDTKLSNLMVRKEADGSLRWWWIDLEDIRAGRRPYLWELTRNFMQINGSIGGHLSDAERKKFAEGFRAWSPWAHHPLLLRYVAFRTRIRLGREVRRECKP